MSLQDLAEKLEMAEAQGVPAPELDAMMQKIGTEADLWNLADLLISYPSLMGAVYRRAKTIEANQARAVGFLAMAHAMAGDEVSADRLLGDLPRRSGDEVVLTAWVLVADTPAEVIARLLVGVQRAPDSLRLWRHLAEQALRSGYLREAERAYLRLAAMETTPEQIARVARVMREQGWPSRQ